MILPLQHPSPRGLIRNADGKQPSLQGVFRSREFPPPLPATDGGPFRPKRRKTMAKEPKYGATLNGWERLLASMDSNPEDFKALEAYRAKLKSMLDTAR